MNGLQQSNPGRRSGFTMVELLVVIVIMLTLATIVVSLTPRFAGTRKLTQGAELVQGYQLIAKQRARRDRLPTGVRLQQDGDKRVHTLQLIQQPDVFSGGSISTDPSNLKTIIASGVDFTGGYDPMTQATLLPVQVGDFLEVKGGGLVHRIVAPIAVNQLTLQSPLPWNLASTTDYRIIRRPRILTGEAPLELPQDIAIESDPWSQGLIWVKEDTNQAQPFADIMFAPSGEMMAAGQNGTAILWVRDASLDKVTDGDPVLITIYTRTGLIAAHPINPDSSLGDYYLYTRDGRSSGL
jgi:prepilin-type N-terminal cleavage/methylation domain-containing protein